MKGCTIAGGDLIDSDYGKPLPWIGLYIAIASFLCAGAMAWDAIRAFRHRKLWFPCYRFSLNSTTLALLAISTKLPVDLNTAMPRFEEQLTKLSGTVLLGTAMGNVLSSLGDMTTSDVLSNVIALAILVVTVIINIGIQIGTGVIYVFVPEHAIVLSFLILLLLLFVSSAIAIPAAKEKLENDFSKVAVPCNDVTQESIALNQLRSRITKFWLMTHSASPQYVLGRSVNSAASGFICILAALILFEALLRGLIGKSSLKLCNGTSDYAWSSWTVVAVQSVAVFVGTIAPAFRWFHAVSLRKSSWKEEFEVESYWIQLLIDWKDSPLKAEKRKHWTKILYQSKRATTSLLTFMQKVVLFSKLFRLLSAPLVSFINHISKEMWLINEVGRNLEGDGIRNYVLHHEGDGVRNYVLHLEGEGEDFVRQITKSSTKDIDKWIKKGRTKGPEFMTSLIQQHSTREEGFTDVCSLLPAELGPNCWALPLVTLAAVAAALGSDNEEREVQSLLRAVGQGLRYVRLIERNLEAKGLVNMRTAADKVWMDVRLYNKWFDTKLRGERSPSQALNGLQSMAQEMREREERSGPVLEDSPLNWPEKMLAAVCMKEVCERILREGDAGLSFQRVRKAIADILGACLTNLPQSLDMECYCNTVEVREMKVSNAARVLGEVEGVLRLLEERSVVDLYPETKTYIDDWRRDRARLGPADLP